MDIVHLMETSTEPLQERISHSYAEIEQTITLDHSEGQTERERKRESLCVCLCVCVLYVWIIKATGPPAFPFLEVRLWPLVITYFSPSYSETPLPIL